MPHGLDVLLQCAELCLKSGTACRALEGAVPSAPLPSLDAGGTKSKAGYASWESIDRQFLTKVQERLTFATLFASICRFHFPCISALDVPCYVLSVAGVFATSWSLRGCDCRSAEDAFFAGLPGQGI